MSSTRHPVVMVSHGPGPYWLLDGELGKDSEAAHNVRSIFRRLYPTDDNLPKRILFITAHWEATGASAFEISISSAPELIYDYYGFPEESYNLDFPAKGDPAFAKDVAEQLSNKGIETKLVERGYDHGVFVPMLLIRPQGDIPIVSMSINDRLDAKTHFAVGQAIAPFRDQDTLIICSGQATHGGFRPLGRVEPWADAFQNWMDDVFTSRSSLSFADRQAQLENWYDAPSARRAHPSPDHFTPFVMAAGAGMTDSTPGGTKLFGGWGGQLSFASYAYGVHE